MYRKLCKEQKGSTTPKWDRPKVPVERVHMQFRVPYPRWTEPRSMWRGYIHAPYPRLTEPRSMWRGYIHAPNPSGTDPRSLTRGCFSSEDPKNKVRPWQQHQDALGVATPSADL
jgi:hypothetical protein